MKWKIFNLLIVSLLMLPVLSHAQLIVTDSVRHELKRYLCDVESLSYPDSYDSVNLWVYSEIGRKWINKVGESTKPIDVIAFSAISAHPTFHILLIYLDKKFIINMNRSYAKIMEEIIKIFRNNPDIDGRLLPLFMHKTHVTFILNTTSLERGGWYDMWGKRDSLSHTLNLELKDWIQ